MKNLIQTLFISLTMTSCITLYSGNYNVQLEEVERPENAKVKYGDYTIVDFKEEDTTRYIYEDEMIKISWLYQSEQFSFTLTNKTDHSIKIIWDDAVYVNGNGLSGRVMHIGTKYVDRNNSQPSTVIVKRGTVKDVVIPTANVRSYAGYYGSSWITDPILPNVATSESDLYNISQKNLGKKLQILLPFQIEDVVNEYMFTFRVNDFTLPPKSIQ